MNRKVEPELLESLPEDDPGAIQSRRDLLLVNGIMGNHRWMLRRLRREMRAGDRLLEIGSGDGALSRRVAEAGICTTSQLNAIDLASRPESWPADASWCQGSVFEEPLPEAEIVIANLILHHFEADELAELGQRLPESARLLIAAEPARFRFHQIQGGLFCRLMGLHYVTRHDMMISIRAGFRGDELASALSLGAPWQAWSSSRPFGAYRFEARKSAV